MRQILRLTLVATLWLILVGSSLAVALNVPPMLADAFAAWGIYSLMTDGLLTILRELNNR